MARRWFLYFILFVVLCVASSCGIAPSDFAVNIVEVAGGDIESNEASIYLEVRNDSQRDISITWAKITVQIKGDDLVTLILDESVDIEANGVTHEVTKWRVRRDDPTTLYAMRRHSIDRYIDRLTFDYEVRVEGISRREKRFGRRGLKAHDFDINFEKLLR